MVDLDETKASPSYLPQKSATMTPTTKSIKNILEAAEETN